LQILLKHYKYGRKGAKNGKNAVKPKPLHIVSLDIISYNILFVKQKK